MKRAIERHERREARVIPIILRHVHWQKSPIGKLQALPTDGKPVKSWQDEDEAFFNVVKGVRKAIEEVTMPDEPNMATALETPTNQEREKNNLKIEKAEQQEIPGTTQEQSSKLVNVSAPDNKAQQQKTEDEIPLINQKKPKQSKQEMTLTVNRRLIAETEKKLDTINLRELTINDIETWENMLREVISAIREDPNQTFLFPSAMLENLRNTCDQLNLAIALLAEKGYTSQYYRSMRTCRRYLEKALNHW